MKPILLKRIIGPVNGQCYCGGQRVFAEYPVTTLEIVIGDDGKQHIVEKGEIVKQGIVCLNCAENGYFGKSADCF